MWSRVCSSCPTLAAADPLQMLTSTKPPKCKYCRERTDSRGRLLHEECVEPWLEAEKARKAREAEKKRLALARVERAEVKRRKEAIKTIGQLRNEAQTSFNRWVRLRDAQLPCISCGVPPPDLSGLHAGRDAGHYRSVGSASHLRFHPDNVHAQCVHCNQHLAGNVIPYRIALIDRIGLERVEALEHDNRVHKWGREELITIRERYRTLIAAMREAA